uniref:Megakaryocyte and platelet inhibitory receptor G6b n=1 Tax=Pipistrellus kuhlii TaxID=59472 RepID=A0A7J7YN79_PIPKU|nr:megakaryocyte and platelet inhibitory receptor G6b [Pipistrellus kuhlii]
MALVLPLLPLLLWRVQGDPLGNSHYRVSLDGRPGERVNLSCAGVSQPVRWVWAPSFPACRGLPKGRHRILSVSASGTPTDSPASPFAGRLRALDHLGIRRLELLLTPDPPAGRRAGAGAGRAGRGLVAAQAPTPTPAAAAPQTW